MGSNSDVQINWESPEPLFRANPKMDSETRRRTERLWADAPDLPGHVWLQSSGSTQSPDESAKWIALSKRAFLVSAGAVNRHLESVAADRWGVCLPFFHVSGLSILARCFLSGAGFAQFTEPWQPERFARWLHDERITLLSLVPTQLFDLVEMNLPPPSSLRAVVLGGARLEAHLYQKAMALGWPALPSFGMTEFCSQIATARPGSPDLILLSHVQAETDATGVLSLKSDSLFSGFLQERRGQIVWEASVTDARGFWRSNDRAELRGDVLAPMGRAGDYVKIKGEGLNLTELRSRFESWMAQHWPRQRAQGFALAGVPDEREGIRLVLAVENAAEEWAPVLTDWNARCFPIERLTAYRVNEIPRSALGKVLWGALARHIR